MPMGARQRFWNLVRDTGVRLVVCGHRHEYRVIQRDDVAVVWAPTTTPLKETTPPLPGQDVVAGLVEYVIDDRTVLHRMVAFGSGGTTA